MAFDLSSIGAAIDTRYPGDMATETLAALQNLLPGFEPRNAGLEAIFAEAVALAVADVSNSANATVAAVEEDILATFYQVPRLSGSVATGVITVTFDSTVTTTIPAGTGFALTDYGVEVATTTDTTVTAATTAALTVSTVTPTSSVNGVGAGAGVDVLDVIPNVSSLAITTAFSGGAEAEDDVAYIARARNRLARVTNSLVVLDHFTAYVLEDGRATNALTIGAWDGVSTGTIGSDAGKVTVVTYGKGAALSSGVRAELAAAMQAITYAGATVNVTSAATTSVNVTTTVKVAGGYSATEVRADVEAALQAYLNPETWTIGDDVIVGALSAVMSDLPGVEYVDSISAPSGTVTIAANAVPVAGTLTVSVI